MNQPVAVRFRRTAMRPVASPKAAPIINHNPTSTGDRVNEAAPARKRLETGRGPDEGPSGASVAVT